MNTTSDNFSWARWSLLVSKHWVENRKRYGLSLLAVGGLLVAWFTFILVMDKRDPLDVFYQYVTYFAGLFITGSLYASMLFAELSTKSDGIGFLALPASHLEKLLCALLFGILLFFIAFTLVFYAVDIPMVQLSSQLIERIPRNWPNSVVRVDPNPIYNVFSGEQGPAPERAYHLFLYYFFTTQSAFILGSVYFTRYSFIKVVIVLVLSLLIGVAIQAKVIGLFLPSGWNNGLTEWNTREGNGDLDKVVQLPQRMEMAVIRLMQWAPPVLFWIVTWFRLKEKQV
jgi:hypothetical protein